MLVAQLFVGVLQAQKPVQNRRQAAGQSMERQGLVNVKAVVPSIKVALMYARTDNFCHRMLYHDLRDAYVLPACADALRKAQAELKRRRPDLSLCIFDATRPMSVQQRCGMPSRTPHNTSMYPILHMVEGCITMVWRLISVSVRPHGMMLRGVKELQNAI